MKRHLAIAAFIAAQSLPAHSSEFSGATVSDFVSYCTRDKVDACFNYMQGAIDQIAMDSAACLVILSEKNTTYLNEVWFRINDLKKTGQGEILIWRAIRSELENAHKECAKR